MVKSRKHNYSNNLEILWVFKRKHLPLWVGQGKALEKDESQNCTHSKGVSKVPILSPTNVCLCRLRIPIERQLWETRAAPRPTYLWSGTCPLQLRAYTQIPSCRRISSGLIAQVALLPSKEEVRSALGVTPSWDRGGWWVWPSDWKWMINNCHKATFSDLETKGVTWTHKLLFEWGPTNWLEIIRNFRN